MCFILTMCMIAPWQYRRIHQENSFIASCSIGPRGIHTMQNLVWMEHAPTVLEWDYWANVCIQEWRRWIWEYGYKYEKFQIYQLWNSPRERKKKKYNWWHLRYVFIYKFMFEHLHFIPYLEKKLISRSFCVTKYKLVTSSRNLLKRHLNMFSMSTWHNGRMISLDYAEIQFAMLLYFQLLILSINTLCNLKMRSKFSIITLSRFPWWCISHIGMAQIGVKSKEKF